MSLSHSPRVVSNGLVLCVDAANPRSYPGFGDTWYDISGNDMNFTLYNSPVAASNAIAFNGVNQYARTNRTLDLTGTSAITVTSVWKVSTSIVQGLVYEHTNNWNAVNNGYGGFGIGVNTNGSTTSANLNHFQLRGNVSYAGVNTASPNVTQYQYYTVIHDFSQPGGEESYNYTNGVYQNNSATSVSTAFPADNTGTFGDDHFYIATRGGTIAFCNLAISYLAIYNRRLSETEIKSNFSAIKGRYGL